MSCQPKNPPGTPSYDNSTIWVAASENYSRVSTGLAWTLLGSTTASTMDVIELSVAFRLVVFGRDRILLAVSHSGSNSADRCYPCLPSFINCCCCWCQENLNWPLYTDPYTSLEQAVHFRIWIMRKFMQFIPWGIIEGTEFQCIALRALGARIGKRVHIHRGVNLLQGGWDLLNIGDDVTLNQDASVVLVELEKEQVVLGPVTLEDGATLDVRAGVAPNTRVGRNARLTSLSWLSEGSVIPEGEMWTGVPAQPVGKATEPPMLTDNGKSLSPIVHGIAMILNQTFYRGFLALPYTLVLVLFFRHFNSYDSFLSTLGNPAANLSLFVAIGAFMCLAQVLMVALEAIASRALGTVSPGVITAGAWPISQVAKNLSGIFS